MDETSPTVAIIFSLTESSGVLTFPIVLTLSDAGGSSATNGEMNCMGQQNFNICL